MAELNEKVPLVIRAYHGTSQDFLAFEPNPRGIFFAEDERAAQAYVGVRRGPVQRVIEARLTIRNPWDYVRYSEDFPIRDMVDQSPQALDSKGYDGVRMPNGVWVVFSPEQVEVVASREFVPRRLASDMSSVQEDSGVRMSLEQAGDGDPSRPFDFSRDPQFSHLFYGEATPAQVKAFGAWLRARPNAFVRLYHGTYAGHPVTEQGLLPASAKRRNSLQSSAGFVCLSAYPGLAYDFGSYASMNRGPASDGAKVAVYPVTITVRRLLADLDQLANRRAFAGEQVGNTLAESLVRGRGARVRGAIEPTCIGMAQRYSARDQLVSRAEPHLQPELDAIMCSFAGPKAKTADLARLVIAGEMVTPANGGDPVRDDNARDALDTQGWFQGLDGKWRFEIDDSQARLLPALRSLNDGGYGERDIASVTYRITPEGLIDMTLVPPKPQKTSDLVVLSGLPREVAQEVVPAPVLRAMLHDQGEEDLIGDFEPARRLAACFRFQGMNALPLDLVLHHPKLFKAYPGLKNVIVVVKSELGIGASLGVLYDGTQVMHIGRGQQLQSILHELQHAIQDIEGFALGGSIETFKSVRGRATSLHNIEAAREIRRRMAEAGVPLAVLRAQEPSLGAPTAWLLAARKTEAELDREIEFARAVSAPVLSYTRLAGEVEARNVQKRFAMSDAQRAINAPWETQDVPEEDQILLLNHSHGFELPGARRDRQRT